MGTRIAGNYAGAGGGLKNFHGQATLIDVTKAVQWRAGPTQVRLRGGWFRGVLFAFEIGQQWGVRENWQLGQVYAYRFVPAEIKQPVLNTLLRSGWEKGQRILRFT